MAGHLHADFSSLMNLCLKKGTTDVNRRKESTSMVLEFGVKAELETADFIPSYGGNVFSDNDNVTRLAKQSLANIVDYIWDVSNIIQGRISKTPLGGCRFRNNKYGSILRRIIGCSKSQFESVTVSHMLLFPKASQCLPHVDKLNDEVYAYSKTACMDIVLEDDYKQIHLLQIICNFRSAVRNRCSVGRIDEYKAICRHFKDYHGHLSASLREKYIFNYKGKYLHKTGFCDQPVDLSDFFLDADLPFEKNVPILNENTKKENQIYQNLLFLTIGTSRVLSMSGFIDPLYQSTNDFSKDQLLELCFLVSFMGTPVIFNEAMTRLQENSIPFAIHPIYNVVDYIETNMGSITAGIKPRFSCCSKTFQNLIMNTNREEMDQRLVDLVKSLMSWITIINSYYGESQPENIPIGELRISMEQVVQSIKFSLKCAKLDFSCFRLSIFTNMIIALRLVQPGPHLRQLNFPHKGTASWDHLCTPTKQPVISSENRTDMEHQSQTLVDLNLGDDNMDECMRTVSDMARFPEYERDAIELHLCESKFGRCLGKVDVFKFGQRIFNLTSGGIPVYKNFGSHGQWIPCLEPNHNL